MSVSPAEFLAMQMRLAKSKPQASVPDDAVERESTLHDEILDFCRSKLFGVIHSRMDRKTTSATGVCDFVILADGGRTFYIEAKSKSGKLSPAQLAFKVQAEMNGHTIHVIFSMSEFLAIVK